MTTRLESTFESGLTITLDNHLQHLRAIKDTEEKWLERMFAVYGGSIAWMATKPDFLKQLNDSWMASLFLLPFVFAVFFLQHVMAKERLSYYRVMRSVVRAQRILGLLEHKFLSPSMQSGAFPLGLGPNRNKDGTQPFSSFGYRQAAIFAFFATFMELAYLNIIPLASWLVWLCLIINLLWVVHLYVEDDVRLYNAVLSERGLSGFDKAWLPEEGTDSLTHKRAFLRLAKRWRTRHS